MRTETVDALSTVYADSVATIALVLALGSVVWQLYVHYRWNRPVLEVTGEFGTRALLTPRGTGGSASYWGFRIVVTNVGNAPTRLLDVCWELVLDDGRTVLVKGNDFEDGSVELEHINETAVLHGVADPEPPLTLASYDAAEWEFYREMRMNPIIAKAVRGRPVVTFVSRNRGKDRDEGNPNTTIGAGPWRQVNPRPRSASAKFPGGV